MHKQVLFFVLKSSPHPPMRDLSLGKSFHGSDCGTSAHTVRLRAIDRFLGDVPLKHQFAPHHITDPGNLDRGIGHKTLIMAVCRYFTSLTSCGFWSGMWEPFLTPARSSS